MFAHISCWITSVQFASARCLRFNNMFFVYFKIQDYYSGLFAINLMLIEAGYLEMVVMRFAIFSNLLREQSKLKGVISFNNLTGMFHGVLLNLLIGLSLLHVRKIR
ncbi:hypothetical protein AMTRI_Chr05g60380 [Amborella trichopoda]